MSYFLECFSVWFCLLLPHDYTEDLSFCQEYHRSHVCFLATHIIGTRQGRLITSDVNCDHWLRCRLQVFSAIK